MSEHSQDDSFKVVDRRLFTAEGELRKEAVEEERREQAAATKAAAAPAASKVQPIGQENTAAHEEPETEIPPSRGFQMLINFLAQNSAAMLGGMPDPRTGKAFVDLEGARELIDMLDALRDVSKGNLAHEDEQLLLEVIGSLKLTFMEMSKAAAAAMREKAKAKS